MSSSAPPLVGREAELRALARALEALDGGRSWALGVVGEPGIGKSRLLGELGRDAAGRGHLVVTARAAELERDVPFALWVEALDGPVAAIGAEELAGLGEARLADLAVALPGVGRATGVAPAPTVERHRVARAVRAVLERLGAQRPVTVVLDDVHWGDPASTDAIALLLHRPPAGAVLLALAARTGRAPELEDALHAAASRGEAGVLEVGPLSREAADALLPGSVGPAARARLYRESGGNPFYLEALAGADCARGPGSAVAGVPAPVRAALAGELRALPPGARTVLEAAAVAGDPFEPELAAAAAGVGEPAALEALDLLLAAGLVRPTDQSRRFRFRHPLVRRAVYEGAGGGWRLAAHARAAEALAARDATPAQRAHHVERAARPGELAAVDLLVAAAGEAGQAAPATAAGWYEAALRLLPEGPAHDTRRRALLRARGGALASAGRAVEARDALRQALVLLPPGSAERVEVAETLADLESLWTANPDEARRLLRAERDALPAGTPAQAAALTLAMAYERTHQGDHDAAGDLAAEAQAAARAAGDPVLEAAAAVRVADSAHCRLRRDDSAALAEADRRIAEAEALVQALPDARVAERLQMQFWLLVARFFTGSPAAAAALGERGLAIARGAGQGLLAPSFVVAIGFAEEELGRLDAAEAAAEEALESEIVTGNRAVGFWGALLASRVALARGRVEAAIAHGEAAWEFLQLRPASAAGWTLADARLAAGDPEGARAALEAFGWANPGLWTLDRLRAIDVAVRVLLALGRVDEAERWAERVPVEASGRSAGAFGAIAARAEAGVLLERGAAERAAEVALAGAGAADAAALPLWAARCRTLAGRALAAANAPGRARPELRAAAGALDAVGAWGERDAALRELRRLGDRPRPPAAPGDGDGRLAALSRREAEVAALVGDGRTNAQIAARLHLSESTVEKHVSRVLGKLGVPTRAGVVALIARDGSGVR